MDHDLHPYSATSPTSLRGPGRRCRTEWGNADLQEAELTIWLDLTELRRIQAVLAAAVLLREAGAPICREFIVFRKIVRSPLGALLVHLVVS